MNRRKLRLRQSEYPLHDHDRWPSLPFADPVNDYKYCRISPAHCVWDDNCCSCPYTGQCML